MDNDNDTPEPIPALLARIRAGHVPTAADGRRIRDRIRAQVEQWGARCHTFDAACPACHAWRMFDMDRDTVPTAADVMAALEEND